MPTDQLLLLAILLLFDFTINLPLGYLRESSRKFSFRWFFLIHVSIPFIITLRAMLGFSWHWIPLTIACAIIGQIVGGQIRKRTLE